MSACISDNASYRPDIFGEKAISFFCSFVLLFCPLRFCLRRAFFTDVKWEIENKKEQIKSLREWLVVSTGEVSEIQRKLDYAVRALESYESELAASQPPSPKRKLVCCDADEAPTVHQEKEILRNLANRRPYDEGLFMINEFKKRYGINDENEAELLPQVLAKIMADHDATFGGSPNID